MTVRSMKCSTSAAKCYSRSRGCSAVVPIQTQAYLCVGGGYEVRSRRRSRQYRVTAGQTCCHIATRTLPDPFPQTEEPPSTAFTICTPIDPRLKPAILLQLSSIRTTNAGQGFQEFFRPTV